MGIAILIRHGRSTANVDGILAGRTPGFGLHDSGREQAHTVARAFHGITPTSIHVSPLERTLETASIIFGDGFTTADALLECDYGTWSGRRLADLTGDPLWERLHAQPSATRFPHGESIPEVAHRVIEYVGRTSADHGLHVFVTHADPIMMLAGHAAGAPLDHYQHLDVEPCSITVLLVDGHRFGLVALNVPPSGAEETLRSLAHWQRTSVGEGGAHDAADPSV